MNEMNEMNDQKGKTAPTREAQPPSPARQPCRDGLQPYTRQPPASSPRHGEECGSLTYAAALHMWLYVASYSDQGECWKLRAHPLHTAYGVPFLCVFIGDTTPRADHRARPRAESHRYIPGCYAATYASPRGRTVQ